MNQKATLIACLTLASLAITAWEFLLTRAASVYYYFDLAYLVLALCLAGIGLGALIARRRVDRLRPWRLLASQLALSFLLWPLLNRFDAAWYSASFALPFAAFGALSAVTWYRLGEWRGRVQLYVLELVAAVLGMTLAGPAILSASPLDVLGDHGVDTHLKQLVREESLVRHTPAPSSWAQTDLIRTSREDVRYVFTDGMFVTRSVAWDGRSPSFSDPELESLAKMKRLAFAAAPEGPVALLGAGAGFDVALALQSGADDVAVVEINPATLRFARDLEAFAGNILTRGAVTVFEDDARRFVQRSHKSYAHINITLIQTSPAAARARHHVDARILTEEAVLLYLRKLRPGGVLTVIQNTEALARATSQFLRQVVPKEYQVSHFRLAGEPRNPFRHLFVVREIAKDDALQQLAAAHGAVTAKVEPPRAPYRPVTDDRPFFFESGTPFVFQNQLLALACTLLILLLLASERRTSGMLRCQLSATIAGAAALAYQIMAVYHVQSALGLPGLAMAAAVAAVLGGAGLGALFFYRRDPRQLTVGIAGASSLLVYTFIAPGLPTWLAGWPAAWASASTLLLTTICALPLGLPFLVAVQQATDIGDRAEARVIALDGLGGLLGATAGSVVVLTFGYSTLGVLLAASLAAFAGLGGGRSPSRG